VKFTADCGRVSVAANSIPGGVVYWGLAASVESIHIMQAVLKQRGEQYSPTTGIGLVAGASVDIRHAHLEPAKTERGKGAHNRSLPWEINE